MSEPLTREEVGKRLYTSLLDRDTYSEAVYNQLLATMDALDTLREWKRSMLEVEAEWNVQAVGKAIGAPLGTAIRQQILPALDTLRRELADERERGARLAAAALDTLRLVDNVFDISTITFDPEELCKSDDATTRDGAIKQAWKRCTTTYDAFAAVRKSIAALAALDATGEATS